MTEAAIQTQQRPRGRSRLRPGAAAGRWSLRGVALLYLGLFILLPVAAIIQRGFGNGLANLTNALGSFGAWNAIRLTLIMAALTAVINGIFGTLLAYVLVRIKFPGRSLVSTLVDLPFAIPTLVAGVMLVALYGPSSAVGGWLGRHGIHIVFAPAGILLALLFVTLPLVVRTVQPVLLELDPAEEEAARVLGAGQWTTFRKVVFPALRPAITAGSLQAFARSLGEFGAIVVVAGNIPNKTLTAPVFISQLINPTAYGASGGPDEAAAVSALLFGLAFVIVLATEKISSRGARWLR
ncbi:MAG TPA: ABC transporter permease [Streptosporangiaceae bacterium]|nr:ABC transporter permease [Streptosporangiaceae bacterium]